MIFVLDLILIVNLLFAFRFFKNVVSPPILMGAGMLAASLIATSYYKGWEMDKMMPVTVFIIGGGTCFFTLCCVLYENFTRHVRVSKQIVKTTDFPVGRIRVFLIVAIIIGVLGCLLKLYYYRATFGSLEFSELIMARRLDQWSGTDELFMPSYVRQLGSFTIVASNFTLWLLALMICYKDVRIKKVRNLLLIHSGIIVFDGMLSGAKGYFYTTVMQFAVLYMFCYYAQRGNFRIARRTYIHFFLIIILLAFSFRGLGLLLGRELDDSKNSDVLAEYCGAEIKNFDILIHRTDGGNTQMWGETTFSSLYDELGISPATRLPGEFQYVGNYSLGNVYTQYSDFYKDWGILGCFSVNILIAVISMFFYKKSQTALKYPMALNVYLFVYAVMAITIFMAFFSNRFINSVISMGWVRSVIYVIVMVWFLDKYVLKVKYKKLANANYV